MDRRARKTQTALVAALRALLPRYPWSGITVQAICDEADVSRSTFYAHFDDRQALLDLAFDALKDGLTGSDEGRGLATHGTFRFVPALAEHMRLHQPLFELNRATEGSVSLTAQFQRVVGEMAKVEAAEAAFCPDHLTFAIGGVFAVLEDWRAQGFSAPSDDIVGQIDDACSRLLLPSSRLPPNTP